MKCVVLVLGFVACARVVNAAAAASCRLSEEFFERHNASADDSDGPGPSCGGHCCSRTRENRLRQALRHTAAERAAAVTRPIGELLLSTRRTLQEHLIALSHQSQNKTAALFTQVYREYASRAHVPLSRLFEDIRQVLRVSPEELGSPPPRDLAASAGRFFREEFPMAYHKGLRLDAKQFTPQYEACLRDAYDAVQPFGDMPQQMATSLSKNLEAARVLLQVLSEGASVLASTEKILATADEHCSAKLLRAAGCPRCKGHAVRPCRNYCLNVARGCIGSVISELDAPWAGYVNGVERLSHPDADAALRGLPSQVSEAILHALENQVILEKKVRQECGPHTTVDYHVLPTPRPTAASRWDSLRAPPPDTELLQFAATLAESKKLFATIADSVCEEPDFAHDDNDHCWNGDSIGEYAKALVASSSLSDQRYNPEMPEGISPDQRVAPLGDKLSEARKILLTHTNNRSPTAEAFMQRDEAGEDGSGSGRSYPDDDSEFDEEGSGEGSGEGPYSDKTGERTRIYTDDSSYSTTEKPSSAFRAEPLVSLSLCITLLWSITQCIT